jgi:hypothetical protein
VPLELKVTVPVGADLVGESVSDTGAVQVDAGFNATELGAHTTEVEVVRLVTARSKVPELVLCTSEPP